jgi:hypothetical protein
MASPPAGTALAQPSDTEVTTPARHFAGKADWLQDLRAEMAKFRNPAVAEKHGYTATDECMEYPFTGADGKPIGGMGYHYANKELLADPRLRPNEPEVLVYVPTEDGGRELGAIEWLKDDDDQRMATADDRPRLFGREFQGPMEPHSNGRTIHYDMHLWLFKHNPKGLFEPWNPRVKCPARSEHT